MLSVGMIFLGLVLLQLVLAIVGLGTLFALVGPIEMKPMIRFARWVDRFYTKIIKG
jgi:hypothetical protein